MERREGDDAHSHSSRERLKPPAHWRPSLLHTFLHWYFFQQRSGSGVEKQGAAKDAQEGAVRAARVDMCTWNYQRVSRYGGAALWCPQVCLRPVLPQNPSTRLLRLLRACVLQAFGDSAQRSALLGPSSHVSHISAPLSTDDLRPLSTGPLLPHSITWTAKCEPRRGWCRHQRTIPWKRRWRRFWLPPHPTCCTRCKGTGLGVEFELLVSLYVQ